MSYQALYRVWRPQRFDEIGYADFKKRDHNQADQSCLFICRTKGNWQDLSGKNLC